MTGEGHPIAVLGAGSWGTALATHLGGLGRETVLWARSSRFAAELESRRENRVYLPGVVLPESVSVTADLASLAAAEIVLVVVPSHGFRQVLRSFLEYPSGQRRRYLVSATKGIEGGTHARMSDVSREEAANAGAELCFAVVSGPSFALELVQGSPTAAVIASEDESVAARLQKRLSGANLRLYSTSDVVGVELGGTIKNVIAIAAGVVSGLRLGNNARAALITRGLHEMTRLGTACGGQPQTFSGLAGLGDLVLTCTSRMSRNQRIGEALAAGKTLAEISAGTSMVAEGIRNCESVLDLARSLGVEMPITEQMVHVLYDGKSPRQAVEDLMARVLKSEIEV